MMRLRPHFQRPTPATMRLSLSYLAIIMVLSLGFSLVFYGVSMRMGLNVQVLSTISDPKGVPEFTSGQPAHGVVTQPAPGNSTKITDTTNVAEVDEQLKKRLLAVQESLKKLLVAFNAGILCVGSVFSYVLARRTLRPIEASMNAQAQFASDASHEFRTPLAVMQTELEVALNQPDLRISRAKTALKSCYQEVIRLKLLSDGLLRLALTEQRPDVSNPVALDEVANEAINQLLKSAQAKRITITDDVPRLYVLGDKQGLVQILVILLDNAIKYSPDGTTVRIVGDTRGKNALLHIQDQGYGIAKKDIRHIFERFYRADTSRTRQGISGYGLGLSIAYQIARQHDGAISVASVIGEGSTFTLQLPVKK